MEEALHELDQCQVSFPELSWWKKHFENKHFENKHFENKHFENKHFEKKPSPGLICREFSMILKFKLALIFPSKN